MHSLSFCLRPENIRAVPAAYFATWLPPVSDVAAAGRVVRRASRVSLARASGIRMKSGTWQ